MFRKLYGQLTCAAVSLIWLIMTSDVFANEFRVYWNIPTFYCTYKFKLPSVNVTDLYGILQNDGDNFRGNQVSILYDPGLFPALLEDGVSNKLVRRNGGVPQRGNIDDHLQHFTQHVNDLIPDHLNNGLAIIDFESWRPVYRQNFGALQPYKDLSEQLVRQEHRLWPKARIETEAARQFETNGQVFMRRTIELAKKLRPHAKWGYYGLPFCFNGKGENIETCAQKIQNENDRTQWLYDASQIIYPSVYMTEKMPPSNRAKMVRGRVRESQRLAQRNPSATKAQVIVYHRFVFTDTGRYLSEVDTLAAVNAMRSTGADGVVLWGASKDLNTEAKCKTFYAYLENVLGPVVRSFDRSFTVAEPQVNRN